LRRTPGICVLTGGQTGVDTDAAAAALGAGLPVHLVFPRGFRQEDGSLTPSRRSDLHGAVLHELDFADFADRTWACVGLSDAVVLIDPAGGDGCLQTAVAARDLGRPLLTLATQHNHGSAASDEIAGWLERTGARVLMVAGCRGSLLAAARCRQFAADQAAAVVSVARQRHDRLTS